MSTIDNNSLIKLLKYDQEIGSFVWLVKIGSANIGDSAGWVDRDGYHYIRINKSNYLAHRLACLYVTGSFPDNHIDHINHNRSDNRFINLREVKRADNQKNKSKNKNLFYRMCKWWLRMGDY